MPSILSEDNLTATVQPDQPGSNPITIAKHNPDGSVNQIYLAMKQVSSQSQKPAESQHYDSGGVVAPTQGGSMPLSAPTPDYGTAPDLVNQNPGPQSTLNFDPGVAPPVSAAMPLNNQQMSADVPGSQPAINTPGPQSAAPSPIDLRMPVSTHETITSGTGYTPADLGQMRYGFEAQQRAEQQKAADISAGASQTNDLLSKKAGIEQDQADLAVKQAQQQKDASDAYINNVGVQLQALKNQNIVPKTIMEEGNTGHNVVAGLALALGAMGGALTGSHQNVALDIFNKAIDRDMEAQRDNLNKNMQVTSMTGVYYKAARDMGMDDAKAQQAAKSLSLKAIATEADRIANTTNSKITQDGANALIGKLNVQAAEADAAAHGKTEDKRTDTTIMNPSITDVPESVRTSLDSKRQTIANIDELTNILKKSQDRTDTGALSGPAHAWLVAHGLGGKNATELNENIARVQNDVQGELTKRLTGFSKELTQNMIAGVSNNQPVPQMLDSLARLRSNIARSYYNEGPAAVPAYRNYRMLNKDELAQDQSDSGMGKLSRFSSEQPN